jgi:hypothetical protein
VDGLLNKYSFNTVKKTLLILLTFFSLSQVQAQYYTQEIDISIGLGMSVPYDEVGYFGLGFYAQGEYVRNINEWIDVKPYAGYILAKMEGDLSGSQEPGDRSTANAFLFGGKGRFRIPNDYVAPYAEIGLGGSIGSFEVVTSNTNINESGVFMHIPFSLGLELGPRNKVNVELTSYFHPSVKQYLGAIAVGLRIPVGYY